MVLPRLPWVTLAVAMTTLAGLLKAQECEPGYTSEWGECEQCMFGRYKNDTGPGACARCPEDGNGHSATTRSMGSVSKDSCFFIPYITEFSPVYGPLAGGTLVNIMMRHLQDRAFISASIARVPAQFHSRSNTSVTLLTGASAALTGSMVEILMSDELHEFLVRSERYFFYKPNPIIHGIDNPETILSGGTLLIVRGDNLNWVSKPELVIIRVYAGQMDEFSSLCNIINSTLMTCPVPDMTQGLPPSFLPGVVGAMSAEMAMAGFRRDKRAVEEPAEAQNNTLQYFIGFRLDGVTQYTNITSLKVHQNPEFERFPEPGHLKLFPPGTKILQISGQHLDVGVKKVDIRVTVGAEECNVTFLTANQLVCEPPASKPEPGDQPGPDGSVFVTVYVGDNLSYVIGYLKYGIYRSDRSSNSQIFPLIMSLLGVFLTWIIILWVTCVLCCRRRRKNRRQNPVKRQCSTASNTASNTSGGGSGDYLYPIVEEGEEVQTPRETIYLEIMEDMPSGEGMENLDDNVKRKLSDCQLESDRLTLGDIIGKGSYGCILKGELRDSSGQGAMVVAVKTIQGSGSPDYDWRNVTTDEILPSFLEESLMLKGFRHPHIVSLHGVVIKDSVPYVVFEYMDHGDLKKYLSNGAKNSSYHELLGFSTQVAEGMVYLSSVDFVHKDLAARNCLINSHALVKVGDFGLSKDLYSSHYYQPTDHNKPLPVKWMAPESLSKDEFTSKSDVWSFGVLMWEVLTKGDMPYPAVDNGDMREHLLAGHRLEKPKDISPKMEAIMDECWAMDPDTRPSFADLAAQLRKLLDGEPALTAVETIEQPAGYLQML